MERLSEALSKSMIRKIKSGGFKVFDTFDKKDLENGDVLIADYVFSGKPEKEVWIYLDNNEFKKREEEFQDNDTALYRIKRGIPVIANPITYNNSTVDIYTNDLKDILYKDGNWRHKISPDRVYYRLIKTNGNFLDSKYTLNELVNKYNNFKEYY